MEKELLEKLKENIIQGRMNKDEPGRDDYDTQGHPYEGQPGVTELISQAIEEGVNLKAIVEAITEAMGLVGELFEKTEYEIPDMLASADAVGIGMDILEPHLVKEGIERKGKIVMATVEGDIHDVGKNIVALVLKGNGFEVIDLGADVSTQNIIKVVKEEKPDWVGLSALLSYTMSKMEEVTKKLKEEKLPAKVIIGGAPTSLEFSQQIGANAYGKTAFDAIGEIEAR